MSQFGAFLAALALTVGTLAAGQATVDDARKKDVYAVYSLAIPSTKGPDGNDLYLIAEKTGTRTGPLTSSGTPCVVPPTQQQSWSEAVAEFSARGATSLTLDRSFTLDKPYQLIDEAAIREFSSSFGVLTLPGQPPAPLSPRFQGAKGTYAVSDVFFNKDRTLALVFVSSYCGSVCGRGEWRVFEKPVRGDWRAASLPCMLSWIA